MSAPNTNIEKQTRRHKPALYGLVAVVGFGAVMFLSIFFTSVDPSTSGVNDAINVNSADSE